MVRFEGTDERRGKGMRSVRFRIVALFVLVGVGFSVSTATWHMTERENLFRMVEVNRKERKRAYESAINTRLKQLDTTVLDYTLWDDFVEYIADPDPVFAKEQVDLSTDTMHTTALWVYDVNGKLVHAYGTFPGADAHGKSLSPEFVKHSFATRSKVKRYFLSTSRGVNEVVGSSIHGSRDTERTGKIYGFFVVSRPWTNRDLFEISKVANAYVSFRERNADSNAAHVAQRGNADDPAPSVESIALPGPEGSPAAHVDFTSENVLAKEMFANIGRATRVVLAFAVTIIGLAFLCIIKWVGRPLAKIKASLEDDNAEPLRDMSKRDDEFAQIALMIHAFFDQRDSIARHNADLEQRVVQRTQALQTAYDLTIEGWAKALELRDHETEGHSRRVTEMSVAIGVAMGLTDEQIVHLRRGALLHDIGKVGIPDSILFKDGPLTPDERAVMEQHPLMAYEMFKDIPFLEPALPVALHHHERWDGEGYPHGLKGEDIPISARIFALADVWDALRSDRPYRAAWTEERVRDHIASLAGSHFDPEVVQVYLNMPGDVLQSIRGEYQSRAERKAA